MSLRTILVVFSLALVFAQAKLNLEEAKKNFEKCKAETEAEEDFESTIKEEKIPSSDKGMCLVECLLRTKGMQDENGNFNREGTHDYLSEMMSEQPELIEKAMKIAEECSKIDVSGLNSCEAAVKRVACGKAKAAQENIKIEKS